MSDTSSPLRPVRRLHRRVLRLTILAAGLLPAAGATAGAATFDVNARIFCPTSVLGPNMWDTAFTTVVTRPCAGIRVVAVDSDPGFDEYCGAGYTDARGRVRFRAECGDTVRPLPDVFLRVEARSAEGFSVGVVDADVLEAIVDVLTHGLDRLEELGSPIPVPDLDGLRLHRTFTWLSPITLQARDRGSLDFGDPIAGAPASGPVSVMSARMFTAAQFTMLRLGAGTRYRPMHFNYTVNAPLPAFTLAFAAYDTVVVDATRTAAPAPALAGSAHEIGHVLYNTYHRDADIGHWVEDCLGTFCFRNSPRCGSVSLGLAWYEGFGDFVRDYVSQIWDWRTFTWIQSPPPPPPPPAPPALRPRPGCALEPAPAPPPPPALPPSRVDMSLQGNVQGLLNNVFFGPVRPGLLAAANPLVAGFSCPDGGAIVRGPLGEPQCDLEVPATCATGTLRIDADGDRDDCLSFVEDPRCARERDRRPNLTCPYDPVRQVNTPFCPVRVARSGRDACATRVPATHALPNGRPRARPDGSPDMMLGAAPSGGQAWFSLPDLDDVMEWVDEAGTDDHRAREYWENRIRPWCRRRDGSLLDRYCHPQRSPSFFGELTTLDPALN